MGTLLKLEFARFKKQKSFYVCLFISLALLALSNLIFLFIEKAPGEISDLLKQTGLQNLLAIPSSASFSTVAAVFAVLFVCEDYSQKTVKNIYAKGFSKKSVYLSKLIMLWIAVTVMYLTVEIFGFIMGYAMFDIASYSILKMIAVVGTQYIVLMTDVAIGFAFAGIIRKTGGAIAIVIFLPMVLDLLLTLADSIIKLDSFSFAELWTPSFITSLSDFSVNTARILTCLSLSVIYSAIAITAGLFINEQKEI